MGNRSSSAQLKNCDRVVRNKTSRTARTNRARVEESLNVNERRATRRATRSTHEPWSGCAAVAGTPPIWKRNASRAS